MMYNSSYTGPSVIVAIWVQDGNEDEIVFVQQVGNFRVSAVLCRNL